MKISIKYYQLLFCTLSICGACQSNTIEESVSIVTPAPQQQPLDLNVVLNMTQPSYNVGSPITLRFVLKNNSSEAIQLCTLNSPAYQNIWTNCFRIRDNHGNAIPFIGQTENYTGAIKDKHLITIEGNEMQIYTIDIRTSYQLNTAGTYTIRFIGDNINSFPNSLPARFIIK